MLYIKPIFDGAFFEKPLIYHYILMIQMIKKALKITFDSQFLFDLAFNVLLFLVLALSQL